MSHVWTKPREHAYRDAYLDWSRLIGLRRDMLAPARPDRGTEYAPILVRLVPSEDVIAARTALRDLVEDMDTAFLMDATELAALKARIDTPQDLSGLPDEYMIFRRIGTPDGVQAALFEVLDSGMPVQIDTAGPLPEPIAPVPPSAHPGQPIVAILDDGIGFLNARFCRMDNDGQRRTRFHALWMQALEQHDAPPKGTVSGRILGTADINALLDEMDERACYAALNTALYPGQTRDETGFGTTHGTHVLDLAAGADPADTDDPARNWPLLGVQLPPESIDDTSGTWFESYLIMGLRWILRQARQVDATAPVIVNISLGVLAGPKDGSRFVEYQMAREARLWEAATGQPVRLVWAFGNSYRSSQVARCEPVPEQHNLTWRVQPDDETASFVEIHCRGADTTDIEVGLTTPDGVASGLMTLKPGEISTLERADGAALARIYHVPARRHDPDTEGAAHYVLALAPTRGHKAGEPLAPCGAWEISIKAAVEVLVQVQRDDAIRGAEARGRQSYLDHSAAYAWDPLRAAYVAPGAAGPITDEGSHNALVTAACRQVFCVAAAQRAGRENGPNIGNFRAAAYSGQGATWSVPGPSVATVVGLGAFAAGVRAAGTLSGSTRRLTGTSAAAGRLTRALAVSARRITANAKDPASTKLDDIDPALLILTETPDARLGKAVVDLPDPLPAC
ncbi:S8 family serine peptidase [Antarctobacter heliothermus]|uniref:Subtilase family protein n=1 Tax=Antarctobacter heliothermus TaxID=74033 RepID=A0A239C559_9RHOB|nr:S8 family serine peptidase [Antarctobacter heliothermus]SNS14781.1 Subtilase family protein [Antarctobacter heliothermus]